MSQFSQERCKTDPDENDHDFIMKKRNEVKRFIKDQWEVEVDNQKLFKKDLDNQSKRIQERIQCRKYTKPMLKSSSCGVVYHVRSESCSIVDSSFDTERLEDQFFDDCVIELDLQRDEKIYRVVRHYNNQISNLRNLGMDEDTLNLMEEVERKKWEEIERINDDYDKLKTSIAYKK